MSDPSESVTEETDKAEVCERSYLPAPVPEARMNETETEMAMLEDEEMPTYISVSSPSRQEESQSLMRREQPQEVPVEEDRSTSPYPSDDQGGGSIYVVSDDDDDEESERPPFGDDDSDDPDDIDDEIDEEDEDDDDAEGMFMDEEGSGEDMEPECYEGASDDFVLRRSNSLIKNHKERSRSLQDISAYGKKCPAYLNAKRRSLDVPIFNDVSYARNSMVYPLFQGKSVPVQNRYQHVESKVKRYIQDIKEQNRRSVEKRIRSREYLENTNHLEQVPECEEDVKAVLTKRTMKNYAERTIKDLELGELHDNDYVTYEGSRIIGNGQRVSKKRVEEIEDHDQNDMEVVETVSEKQKDVIHSKSRKPNGMTEINLRDHLMPPRMENGERFTEQSQQSCLYNGQGEMQTICNLRTLSYEEYMGGNSNSTHKSSDEEMCVVQENENVPYNGDEVVSIMRIDKDNTPCSLKIESVKSIRTANADNTKEDRSNSNLITVEADPVIDSLGEDKSEIAVLQEQLSQRTAQFNGIHDAYQKTLAENFELKRELDDLKKVLAKYQAEHQPRETKVAAVQTETILDPPVPSKEKASKEISNEIKKTDVKFSSSSLASAVSSNDQWSESATSSLAISMKPPNVTSILNSDDSIAGAESTPRKTPRPLSHAFITSSRILQTLSNLTQTGKTKTEDPLARDNGDRRNDSSISSSGNPSNPKKRKATEMLGIQSTQQPSKMAYTLEDSRRKSADPDEEEIFKYPGSRPKTNARLNQPSTSADASLLENSECLPEGSKKTDDNGQVDGVKCFTYEEDENGHSRSFLIQAEGVAKEDEANDRASVRECGPYLLGNVEVRMTEVNGTINIWGKEISEEGDGETEEATLSSDMKRSSWHKTSRGAQLAVNSHPACSTNKKSRMLSPRYINSSSLKGSPYLSAMPRMSISSDELKERRRRCSLDADVVPEHNDSYPNCEPENHRGSWMSNKRISSSFENQHCCCSRSKELQEAEHESCSCERERKIHRIPCNRLTQLMREEQKHSCIASHRESVSKHCCTNDEVHSSGCVHEDTCKHRASPFCANEKHCQHEKMQDSLSFGENVACGSRRSHNSSCHHQEVSESHHCNHSPSSNGSEQPLLSSQRSSESPEVKRRRLSGKKVRGILMDFLKGCGDCRRSSDPIDIKERITTEQKESPRLRNGVPDIRITPNTPPVSMRHHSQEHIAACNSPDVRCCQACSRRTEMAVEMEKQLEFFRVEMERLRSRSDAVINMLNMLHSPEFDD